MEQSKITQIFSTTPSELKENILNDVKAELKLMAHHFQPIQPPEYLTRKEVAQLLKVSVVTLSEWNKKGILKPYRLGNLIRYKSNEIDKALIAIAHSNK